VIPVSLHEWPRWAVLSRRLLLRGWWHGDTLNLDSLRARRGIPRAL
jgi:hypothetical protein